jgi:integrase
MIRFLIEGRIVSLGTATIKAFAVYLRARSRHRLAELSPGLWLGTRNRGPIAGNAVWRMIKRRGEQAGYDPTAHPHMLRHAFANDWLAGGGEEGDLMRLMGWKDRAMLDRYASDMANRRAADAKLRRGDIY